MFLLFAEGFSRFLETLLVSSHYSIAREETVVPEPTLLEVSCIIGQLLVTKMADDLFLLDQAEFVRSNREQLAL